VIRAVRVVVTGLVATYPVGGVAWDYLQYLQGFDALGCEVVYLEDTGQWFYDPAARTFTPDARAGAAYLAAALQQLLPGRAQRWAVRSADGTLVGLDEASVARACAGADLFLNLSGACWLRDAYRGARVTAYVDTDPCYSQAKLAATDAGVADRAVARSAALIREHDVFFTLGEHVGQPDCTVPTAGITWLPTRQPVFLPNWPVTPPPDAGAFTTVLSWSINPTPPVVGGRSYGGKDVEFARFVDLPRRTADRLEAAISGDAPRERLVAAGWSVIEAHSVSATLDDYRRYLQGSRGEWSVAKNAYVATRSGWFSTRSAAYLASGRPAVIEETGFSAHVPTGPGLRAFSTPDEAVAALDAVRADHGAACEHARAVAERCFRAEDVCARLLADAGL
jgi:hypothetical protein